MYEAGPEQIGESLTVCGTGTSVLWDQVYPERWYYGDGAGGAHNARSEAIERLTLGSGLTDPRSAADAADGLTGYIWHSFLEETGF